MSQADAKGEEKKDDKPQVGTMRRGDYMIHVFIEICRQIKCPEGGTVDPIVQLECMGESKFTSAKDDIGSTSVVIWNEHIFFEPRNVTVEKIEQAKVTIKLMNKGMFKDAMLGVYEFDISYIYFMEQHLMLHKWIALSDPSSENFSEVTAYLKLSISVACTGDEQVQITEDAAGGDDSVMMPPSIKPEFFQLRFRFYKGEKLPIMDTALFGKGGSIDAYVLCNYLNQKLKTAVVKMEKEQVFWYQEFLLPVQLPIMSSKLVMKLFDEDRLSDDVVGTMVFNLKDYINQKATEPTSIFFWKNIYGSPLGVSGANTDLMNSNPDLASTWKGRILMQVVAEKTEKPLLKVEDIEDEAIKDLGLPYQQSHEFELIIEVGQGIALPDALKYTVKVRIADYEYKTEKPSFAENTYNRWNQRLSKTTWSTTYQDVYDIGRVYIYLMEGEKAICYASDDIENFLNPDAQYKWYEMTPDLSIGKVKEAHKAGFISMKMSINDKTKNGEIDFAQYSAWKKPPPKRPINFKIRAFVYQCRDLPAADSDGQSDPYIVFWDQGKERKQTKVIEDNVNPLFYETIELSVEANSFQNLPPFILDIYDKDFNPLDSDDFISRAYIPLEDAVYSENDTVPKPKWHACRLKKGAPDSGEILISFSIVPDDYSFKTPLKYMDLVKTVDFDEYGVEISILGLRDLQSVGILPVKKAFIQFNLKSLVPPNCAQSIQNIKTQPGPPGANPTINTLMKFTIPLPNDPLYCPRLQCQVFDNIFKSFMQPLLGVFVIPIGEIMFKKQSEREEFIMGLRMIITELNMIIQDMGVTTYNVQPKRITIDRDLDFKKAVVQEKKQVQQIIEKKFVEEVKKIDAKVEPEKVKQVKEKKDTLFEPLLLNLSNTDDGQYSEFEKHSSRRGSMISHHSEIARTPRKTPRSILEELEKSKGNQSAISNMSGKSNISKKDANSRKNSSFLNNSMAYFNKATDIDNKALGKEYQEELERSRRDEEQEREISIMEMKGKGEDPNEVIKFPSYKLDELLMVYREINCPPSNLYIGLGWDEVPEDNRKHFRKYFPDELENVKEMMPVPSPFDQYNLKRGQTRGASKGFFSKGNEDESGAVNTEQVVGKFKCIIDIEGEKEKQGHKEVKDQLIHDLKTKLNQISLKKRGKPLQFELEQFDSLEEKQKFAYTLEKMGLDHLKIPDFICNMEQSNKLRRLLLGQNTTSVRLYMISAYDLAQKDLDSPSDPYLYITLGEKVFNEREFYQNDNANPDFHKLFEFNAVFPGCPMLKIQCYDYDELFGDDLIGETNIDLEDRFFSQEWQQIIDKPVEYRQLYHPSSSISQGVVKLWVEILPQNLKPDEGKMWEIQPRPVEQLQVRVCVFDTLNIKAMDDDGCSDVYVRCFFDSKEEAKETDTHFRCQDGKASFNYRLLFTTKNIRKDYNFCVQGFDRDLLSANDIIGENKVNLKQVFEDVTLTKKPISLCKKYYELVLKPQGIKMEFKDDTSFWVELETRNDKGKLEKTGKIRIQLDVMPMEFADQNKVGEARQEPNCNPFLPPPVGRISLSFNPWKMFQQLVGPALRRKIYCACCCAICLSLCVMIAPMIISQMISNFITNLITFG